jgi:dCMP deaminase
MENGMTNERISSIRLWIEVAILISKRSRCEKKQVGCVIIDENDRIITHGYNGTVNNHHSNCCEDENGKTLPDVVHAEQNAIAYAAKKGLSLENATIFCTHSPCIECAKLLIQVGIKRIYFLEIYKKGISHKFLTSNNIDLYQIKLEDINEEDNEDDNESYTEENDILLD